MEFSNDGNWVVVSATNDKFGIYDMVNKEWIHNIALFGGGNNLILSNGDLSTDNRFIAAETQYAVGDPQLGGSWNDEIIHWDVMDEQILATLPDVTHPIFNQAGEILFTMNRAKKISVWNLSDFSMIDTISMGEPLILSPDGTLLITRNPSSIQVFGIRP